MLSVAKKLFPSNSLYLDIANDLYLSMAEQPLANLVDIHTKGMMEGYIYRSIHNNVRNQKGRFALLYKRERELLYMTTCDNTAPNDMAYHALERLTDFEMKILALYIRHESVSEASAATRIHKRSFLNYINQIKAKLS